MLPSNSRAGCLSVPGHTKGLIIIAPCVMHDTGELAAGEVALIGPPEQPP
jgi:hypothetical protein